MYGVVRGRWITGHQVGRTIVNFGWVRSSLMGGGVWKWEDARLWWHGIC